jgi:hypothetical protein
MLLDVTPCSLQKFTDISGNVVLLASIFRIENFYPEGKAVLPFKTSLGS